MIYACTLAAASLLWSHPAPKPAAVTWTEHVARTANTDFDRFAVKTVNAVRSADWERFKKLAADKVEFKTSTKEQSHDPYEVSILFDDSSPIENSQIEAYKIYKMDVDTSLQPPSTVLTQFSYFASLVEESTMNERSVPRWNSTWLKGQSPRIWGSIASNATWAMEVSRQNGAWKVSRLVIETD